MHPIIALWRKATYVPAVMFPTNRGAHSLVAITLGLFLVAFLLARQPPLAPSGRPLQSQTQPAR